MKESLIQFAKGLGLVVWAVAAIATSAAVWNAKSGAFYGIMAGIALAIHGWSIYKATRTFVPKERIIKDKPQD